MTRFVLVRHGETVWHAENRYAGSSDIAMTQRGYEQAELLAGWAKTAGLEALWCSTLGRARETAAAVARTTGLEPHPDARLLELDFGQGEGRTTAEMHALFPEALAAFYDDPAANHLPGGEDPHRAVQRALDCLQEIARAHPDGRVLVVAHTTLLRLVLCGVLGLPLSTYRRVFPFVRNGAVTEIRLEPEHNRAALLEFNNPIPTEPSLGPEQEGAP